MHEALIWRHGCENVKNVSETFHINAHLQYMSCFYYVVYAIATPYILYLLALALSQKLKKMLRKKAKIEVLHLAKNCANPWLSFRPGITPSYLKYVNVFHWNKELYLLFIFVKFTIIYYNLLSFTKFTIIYFCYQHHKKVNILHSDFLLPID